MIQKFGTVPNWNVKFRKRGVCCKIAEHSRIEQKPLAFTLVKILKVCQKGKQKLWVKKNEILIGIWTLSEKK